VSKALSVAALAALLSLAGGPGALARQTDAERALCRIASGGQPANDVIRACAKVIESPALPPAELAEALVSRGLAYYAIRDFTRAIADYDRAISVDPRNAAAYQARGNVFDDQQRYAEARADYDRSIELEPGDPAAFFNRGLSSHRQKNFAAAIVDYTECLRIDPRYAMAYFARADVYLAQGEFDAALEDAHRYVKLEPDDDRGLMLIAQIEFKRDRARRRS